MMAVCSGPVCACRQTGELCLTEETNGTLLLWDVARLTFSEQMKLQDWIAARPATAQVISITSSPLLPLVEDGRFLEGLFYRINVVSLVARIGGDSGEAQADMHSQVEQRPVARGATLQ
jgi:transcriptional regulator of aromatic amino acid metabolism